MDARRIYPTQGKTTVTYSVAIRTLALSPDSLRKVLQGVFSQTIRPEKVVVYIARNYAIPSWRVGYEQYVYTDKGMMSQRALPYTELTSDYILMLDDDLVLAPATASRLLATADTEHTDLLGADVFQNHLLPVTARLTAAVSSLVMPHYRHDKAFRLRRDGAFSYIARPRRQYYSSDTCCGPLMLWRRESFLRLHAEDEKWIDTLGYAYGEDALLSYKATANGMKAGIDFRAEVTNLDSRTSSDRYRNDPQRLYIRAKAMFITWWRMCYKPHGNHRRGASGALFGGVLKYMWLTPVMLAFSAVTFSTTPIRAYLRGLRDGYRYVRSDIYLSIPPYIFR